MLWQVIISTSGRFVFISLDASRGFTNFDSSALTGSLKYETANSKTLSVPYLLNMSARIDVIVVLSAITAISASFMAYSFPLNETAIPPLSFANLRGCTSVMLSPM